MAPPTMADAKAAVAWLAKQGAARVLLHGSLARGQQRNGSDIDLVAIYDDVDRSEGSSITLGDEVQKAVGCEAEVEVFVTDRPEWAHRTLKVPSSFEAHIAPQALVLYDRPAPEGAVQWDKEISRPTTDLAEAEDNLCTAAWNLPSLRFEPGELERSLARQSGGLAKLRALPTILRRRGRPEMGLAEREQDSFVLYLLIRACFKAAIAARFSVKAVFALEGRYPDRNLDIAQLGDSLGAKHSKVVEAARAVDAVELKRWQGICLYCLHQIFDSDELSLREEKRTTNTLLMPTADLFDAAADAVDTSRANSPDTESDSEFRYGRHKAQEIRDQLGGLVKTKH